MPLVLLLLLLVVLVLLQTTGYPKDSWVKIEDVEKLFSDAGKAKYVKIMKTRGIKLSKSPGSFTYGSASCDCSLVVLTAGWLSSPLWPEATRAHTVF